MLLLFHQHRNYQSLQWRRKRKTTLNSLPEDTCFINHGFINAAEWNTLKVKHLLMRRLNRLPQKRTPAALLWRWQKRDLYCQQCLSVRNTCIIHINTRKIKIHWSNIPNNATLLVLKNTTVHLWQSGHHDRVSHCKDPTDIQDLRSTGNTPKFTLWT